MDLPSKRDDKPTLAKLQHPQYNHTLLLRVHMEKALRIVGENPDIEQVEAIFTEMGGVKTTLTENGWKFPKELKDAELITSAGLCEERTIISHFCFPKIYYAHILREKLKETNLTLYVQHYEKHGTFLNLHYPGR